MSSQFQQFIASQSAKMDVGTNSKGILATPGTDKESGMPVAAEKNAPGHRNQFRSEQMMGQELPRVGYNIPLPRVELPTFRGENPRGWLRKCRKYFKMNTIPAHQRVEVVSYYLEGKAEI